jgi:hypothetical protein
MTSGGSGEHKKHGRKVIGLEWDAYVDDTQKARTSWKNVP